MLKDTTFLIYPLMKLAAYHKSLGDSVEWYEPMFSGHFDQDLERIYTLRDLGYSPYVILYETGTDHI